MVGIGMTRFLPLGVTPFVFFHTTVLSLMSDFNMETMSTGKAEKEVSTSRGRDSRFNEVGDTWESVEDKEEKSLVLSGLEEKDIQSLRNYMYRRFGKDEIIVRSAQQEDETYKAVIRTREEGEYLRENGGDESDEDAEGNDDA
jgi:hypothetical protein